MSSVADFVIGPFGSAFTVENYCDDPTYRYIRGKDVKPMSIAEDDNVYMPKADYYRLAKYALKAGDVLVSVVGTIGNSALIEPQHVPAIFSCKSTAVRTRSVDPRYLIAFLNSRYGRTLLIRKERGAVQKGLNLDDLRTLTFYVAGSDLQRRIATTHTLAGQAKVGSKVALEAAESSLLKALGLQHWKAPEPLSYVRNSSEAFASGRLDAQHFQPRFRALTDFIDASGQGGRLADWLSENQRGKQPEYAEDGLPVINSKHVLRGEVCLNDENRKASFGEDDLMIRHGDVLMNGTGVGTIGRSAPYLHTKNAIPDNHVTVLRPKKGLDAVYLSVFLNSMAGQWQVEQRLRGSSGQIELYPNDIGKFRIWIAPVAVQDEIRESVETSHRLRLQAAELLEAAKRAVEIAIEDSETAALAYLKEFQ
ncbi:restriction endonuclease subunit S [Rubrivivax albus]|uniref:Restriction endonuclease subunit S n=1 Tax=Rubrivivax albus TaxID=2499835 RepID=A0A437K289_9BURK|nr:restriction endonuclease subunit S [Rubrivivax albus]